MATIRETDVENYLVKQAQERLGAEVYKTVTPGRIGFPDRILFWKGQYYDVDQIGCSKLVEVKKPKVKKPGKRQTIEHRRLAKVGAHVAIVRNYREVDKLLDELTQW